MAEYYPLLAKAIGSLPNSTPDSRRVVYERARKALIGQLRTMHPPVPDEDIDRESVALDRAVERLESELAKGRAIGGTAAEAKTPDTKAASGPARPAATSEAKPADAKPADAKPTDAKPTEPKPADTPPPLRPRMPKPPEPKAVVPTVSTGPTSPAPPSLRASTPKPPSLKPPASRPPLKAPVAKPAADTTDAEASKRDAPPIAALDTQDVVKPSEAGAAAPSIAETPLRPDESRRLRPPQRPIAPQPPGASEPKRRLWIIPVALGVVIALVALAAWKLRDRPETLARSKPAAEQTQDSGKISERVGDSSKPTATETPKPDTSKDDARQDDTTKNDTAKNDTASSDTAKESPKPADEPDKSAQPSPPPASANTANPAVPVAHRAALLVEAPDEPNKVKTFLGTVVWKLDNAPQGANAAVGLAVEADIDLPDDKMKATVMFEKNADASLPASHTIKVRFSIEPGSFSGNVKQISVPQMRPEASPGGETLAGVTVPITTNSFLVGLSPGNAEAANTDLLRRLQWIDIPMMLDNGKIAKLTFEKSDSGQRDISEALETWQKQ